MGGGEGGGEGLECCVQVSAVEAAGKGGAGGLKGWVWVCGCVQSIY
jgi:hypothetical protein